MSKLAVGLTILASLAAPSMASAAPSSHQAHAVIRAYLSKHPPRAAAKIGQCEAIYDEVACDVLLTTHSLMDGVPVSSTIEDEYWVWFPDARHVCAVEWFHPFPAMCLRR